MCFRDADGKVAVTLCNKLVDLRLCFGEDVDAACAVYLRGDLGDLLFDGISELVTVNGLLLLVLLKDGEGLVSEVDSAFAALCKDLCRCEFSACGLACFFDYCEFFFSTVSLVSSCSCMARSGFPPTAA